MSTTNTPTKGLGGRTLKSWELAALNPVDIHNVMSDFLKHIEKEAIGSPLAAIAKHLRESYEKNDNDARQFCHGLQKRFQKELEVYDTEIGKFFRELALGFQNRAASLEKGQPIPDDFAPQMETWLNQQFAQFQNKLKQKKQKVNSALGQKDTDEARKRTEVFETQNKRLLELLWDVKNAVDSGERTVEEMSSALAVATPTRAASGSGASASRTMLPSTPTRSVASPSGRPHKRRRIMDHFDPPEN